MDAELGAEEDLGGEADAANPALSPSAAAAFIPLSAWQQTLLAAQQLGIIVGVALLVGGGFMLMVAIELSAIWLKDKVSSLLGTETTKDPEDPAALVGSFKRYK